MEGKKIAVAVVLAAFIGLVVYTIVKKNMVGAKPPDFVLQQKMEKIDQKTLTLITKTLGEWEHLGKKGDRYKNPETGEYTMMDAITCASCGAKVPAPDYSILYADPNKPVTPPDIHQFREAYLCPKCGKQAVR